MMLGRIIERMLRCVKKKDKLFYLFVVLKFFFYKQRQTNFFPANMPMLQCSIKTDYYSSWCFQSKSRRTRTVPST